MGDVVDQETADTGERRAGSAFALLSLTNKIGYALSVGITYPLLDRIGFTGKPGAVNVPYALTAILIVFVALPAVLLVVAVGVLWRFPLGEPEQRRLRTHIADSA